MCHTDGDVFLTSSGVDREKAVAQIQPRKGTTSSVLPGGGGMRFQNVATPRWFSVPGYRPEDRMAASGKNPV